MNVVVPTLAASTPNVSTFQDHSSVCAHMDSEERVICFVKVSLVDSHESSTHLFSWNHLFTLKILTLFYYFVCMSMSTVGMSEMFQLQEYFLYFLLFCGMLYDAEEFVHLCSYKVLLWEMLSRFLFKIIAETLTFKDGFMSSAYAF